MDRLHAMLPHWVTAVMKRITNRRIHDLKHWCRKTLLPSMCQTQNIEHFSKLLRRLEILCPVKLLAGFYAETLRVQMLNLKATLKLSSLQFYAIFNQAWCHDAMFQARCSHALSKFSSICTYTIFDTCTMQRRKIWTLKAPLKRAHANIEFKLSVWFQVLEGSCNDACLEISMHF